MGVVDGEEHPQAATRREAHSSHLWTEGESVPVIRSCTESAWPEDRQFRVGCWRCGGFWSGKGGAGALQ